MQRPESARNFASVMFADRMAEEQADVAQLVEQLIRNQQVSGSSPLVGSIFYPPEPVLVLDIH
jgi:hypothetical protein